MRVLTFLWLWWCVIPSDAIFAQDRVDFIRDVHPIFAAHCYQCHGPEEQESSYRLDDHKVALSGGDHGRPAIVPGNAAESPLYQYVAGLDEYTVMPPEEQLSARHIATLKRWIDEGADWPKLQEQSGDIRAELGRAHWAFQPLSDAAPPAVEHAGWVQTPVDRFIVAGYERQGVTPNAVADKRTLIRRVTFDLIGLPPTPSDVESFLHDDAPGAFERVVKRLLVSPHYGERWGRHWMDVVRYADTAGDSSDFPIPDMFRYRNYIIRSFNDDKPYDCFLREQLAGDLLPADTWEQRNENIVATGYLANALRFGNAGPEPYLTIEDTINNLGQGILAMTIQCARCHDHKFDPISARDYYALYGFFDSTRYPHPGHEMDRAPVGFVPLIPENELKPILSPYEARLKKFDDQIAVLREEMAEAKEYYRRLEQAALDESEGSEASSLPEGQAPRTPHAIRQAIHAVELERSAAAADYPVFPKAYAVTEGRPTDAKLQIKGNPRQLGEEVPRGFLEVLGGQTLPDDANRSGRLQLADWIVEHPLTARVIVNRLWYWHFGKGLVPSLNDFGVRGETPTHPELLDYLAKRLIDSGWSIKALHRELVLSRTYQLSSEANPAAAAVDPANRLCWQYSRRRLEAEELRDAMLYIGGRLDPAMPDEPHPFPPRGTWRFSQHEPFDDVYPSRHRSVYLMTKRQRRHPLLAIFDGADTTVSTGARMSSSTPLQALYLYNDPFVHTQAEAFAERLRAQTKDAPARIELAYLLAFGRPPTSDEFRAGEEFLRQARDILRQQGSVEPSLSTATWSAYARVLFRTNEFVYVD